MFGGRSLFLSFLGCRSSSCIQPGRHSKEAIIFLAIISRRFIHRNFFYLALVFIVILTYDVWKALWFVDPATGKSVFGVGVGTIVLAINVCLLSGYTFGCHSLRHLAGGLLDQFSRSPTCYRAYACVTCFNRRHMLWAWLSLFWVGFADLYVRLCAMGIWHDFRIV